MHASQTTYSATLDNDSFFWADQNYTGGFFLSVDIADNNWFDRHLEYDNPADLEMDREGAWEGVKFGLSQMIWTPQYLGMAVPLPEDRPYSGALTFDFSGFRLTETTALKMSFHVGVSGPNSGADRMQQFIHHVLDNTEPAGWDTQTAHAWVVDAEAEWQQRAYRYGDQLDVTFGANARFGSFWRKAGVAVMARFSDDLPRLTGSQGYNKGKYVDPSSLTSGKGHFLFLFAEAHHQFYDQTVQGTLSGSSSAVSLRKERYSAGAGVVWYRPRWGVSASVIYTVPDYKEDWNDRYAFGSLTLFWRQHNHHD
ncbi:lipid A deacylase LpxR family protein [Parasalinivibrio latis]